MPVADVPALLVSIETSVRSRLGAIRQRQAEYLAQHGHYAQVLPTHSSEPVDGEDAAPDQLDAKPHYQAESAADLSPGISFETRRASLRIDQYIGPQGAGWVLTLRCRINGEIWRLAINEGPEDYRDAAWHRSE